MASGCIDETNLTLFVENRLAEPAARLEIERHIDACETCRTLVGRLVVGSGHGGAATSPTPAAVVGTRIDRYVMISELGAGGMGRVYLASDPELDRKVAIKVLRHVDAKGDYDARLRREAQALARVTHPNVAAIYDVGELDDHLFLAMEYVGGGTLSAWLAAEPRTWREVVRVFAGAARGLAAVHATGFVHRDFKPDNVLLDDGGQAKVTDFGLVATLAERSDGVVGDHGTFGALTVTGAVLGTPAYMAPEQFAGGAIDARSDQFSFCVALYEALYGERPFPGTTVAEIRGALAAGLREPAQRRGVPRWLHRAVARGLAIDPAARFRSMDDLAAALSPTRRQRRRRGAVLATAGIAAIAGAGALLATRSSGEPPCDGVEIDAVWNPHVRAALQAAIAGTHAPFAADVAKSVVGSVDHYANHWRATYAQVCEATRVHHTQSVAMMDLRMTCLAGREHELASLIDVLAIASPAITEHAVDLAGSLPSLERCDDVAALQGMPAPPADPSARKELDAAHASRIRAEAEIDSGLFDQAAPIVDQLFATAAKLHDPSLGLQALLLRAHLQTSQGKSADAEATYQHAIAEADRDRADHERAWAWAKLIHVRATEAKLDQAEADLPLAQAAVDRAGADFDLATLWDTTRATIASLRGHVGPANQLFETAIARARARNDRRSVSELLHGQATATMNESDPAHSLALETESIAIAVELYGAHHPEVASRERDLAHILSMEDKLDEALAKSQDAYEILLAAYGADHTSTAAAETTLATLLRNTKKLDDARSHTEHALKVLRANLGDKHYFVADALRNLALIERADKHVDKALAYQQEAHAILLAQLGPDTSGIIASYHTLAELYRDLKRDHDAEAALKAGLAIGERTAPDNPQLGLFYSELGSIHLDANDAAGAEPWLARAVTQMQGTSTRPLNLAWARLDLAHAKAGLGKWTEARDLAIAAKPDLQDPAEITEAQKLIETATRHAK